MAEKMLTFEEWESGWEGRSTEDDFKMAHQGMIPADDPLVIDMRNAFDGCQSWVRGIQIVFTDANNGRTLSNTGTAVSENWVEIRYIPRPASVWRPKDGDHYWHYNAGRSKRNALEVWNKNGVNGRGSRYAAFRSVDEIDWTWEQFQARGDVWEVV